MAVTVEELQIVIAADFKKAWDSMAEFRQKYAQSLKTVAQEVYRQTEAAAKAAAPAMEKAKEQALAVQQTTKKQGEAVIRAEQEISKKLQAEYEKRGKAIASASQKAVQGAQTAFSAQSGKLLELRSALELVHKQMENQARIYEAYVAKSAGITGKFGDDSLQAILNEKKILSAVAAYDRLAAKAEKLKEAMSEIVSKKLQAERDAVIKAEQEISKKLQAEYEKRAQAVAAASKKAEEAVRRGREAAMQALDIQGAVARARSRQSAPAAQAQELPRSVTYRKGPGTATEIFNAREAAEQVKKVEEQAKNAADAVQNRMQGMFEVCSQKSREAVDAAATAVQGAKEAFSAQSGKLLELRSALELVRQQMENQAKAYEAYVAKSAEIAGKFGDDSPQGLANEKRILSAVAAYDRLAAKAEKLKQAMYEAQRPAAGLKEELAAAQPPAKAVERSVRQVRTATDQATGATKRYGKQAQKTGRSSRNVFERLGASIKSMLTVGLLYKMVSAIRQAVTEAMQNIAQSSERANATISSLSTSFTYAKNSIAAAFMPALQALQPVITAVTDKLAELFNWVGMVTARLFGGANTVLQAKKVQVDYAKSLGSTADAAKEAGKEAEKSALSFDELNKLSEPAKDTTSGSGTGTPSPGEMFEEVPITQSAIATANKLQWVMDLFEEYKKKFIKFFKDLKSNPVIKAAVKVIQNVCKTLNKAFKGLLDWTLDNCDTLISLLTGVLAGIATYKIISGIIKLSKTISSSGGLIPALKGLLKVFSSPWALLAAAVVGALVAIGVAIWTAHERTVQADLAKRFGEIELSMEEIQKIAHQIVSTRSLEKMMDTLAQIESLEGIYDKIKEASDTLNKLNWKVGIGLELTEEENESYKAAINDFISQTQEWVNQNHYAVTMATDVLIRDPDDNAAIQGQIDSFYSGISGKLQTLGQQLQTAVNDAYADGLLTVDEAETISNLQAQMASITEKLTKSQFEAKLETILFKQGGVALTPESYQELAEEIGVEVENAVSGFDKTMNLLIEDVNTRFADGAIDAAEVEKEKDAIKKGYLENIGEINLKATNFQLDALYKAFGEELDAACPKMESVFSDAVDKWNYALTEEEMWGPFFDSIVGEINNGFSGEISDAAKENMRLLGEKLIPEAEQLKEIQRQSLELGLTVPEYVSKGLTDIATVRALGGDVDSIYQLVGSTISNSPELAKALKNAENEGANIPEYVKVGMETGTIYLPQTAKDLVSSASDSMIAELGETAKKVEREAKKISQAIGRGLRAGENAFNLKFQFDNTLTEYGTHIPQFASGAVLKKPTLNVAGEYAGASTNPEIVSPQSIMYDTVVEANAPLVTALSEKLERVIEAIQTVCPEITLDGREVGKAVQKYREGQMRLTGVVPV